MKSTLLIPKLAALVLLVLALLRPPFLYFAGTVSSVNPTTKRLIIDRDALSEGAPATRMSYIYTGRRDLAEVERGDRIGFAAHESNGIFEIGGIWELPKPRNFDDNELVYGHHHDAHHGGIVGMVGEYHVEALASRDGVVRAYLSDISRRPLSMRGMMGKAILHKDDKPIQRALGRMSTNTGPAMGTRFDPFEEEHVVVEFDLFRGEENINIEFVLPLARAAVRKPVLPKRCDSSQRPEYYAVSEPWCSMDFGRAIAAVGLAPRGDFFLVAPVDLPVTAWNLPDGKRRSQFKPAPEVEPAPGHHEHAEASNALVPLEPDGAEAVVVLENRFLRYATESGRLLGELPAADGLVLDAQRPRNAEPLIASLAYRSHLIRVSENDDSPAAIAQGDANADAFVVNAKDGRVAVAYADGRVAVYPASGDGQPVDMSTKLPRVSSLTFAGEYLAATSKNGIVRAWHATTGGQVGERGKLPAQLRLASDPAGRRVVAGGVDGDLRLFTVPALRPGLQMSFHKGAITGLQWQGESILSGDESGRVAVWRFSPPGE